MVASIQKTPADPYAQSAICRKNPMVQNAINQLGVVFSSG